MNNTDPNSEQNDQQTIPSSLRLALIASILTTIADGIGTISALAAIDEQEAANEKEKQAQKDLDDKFQKVQLQIDKLTNELSRLKYRSFK
ncbi:hypothetical protein CVD28_12710 [Bacillus sp. M6-12]|uniref:hypothetical protein n=1 Tax=Bacillus sp. M6-12 TaxID=2054166 RepID=UPI000C793054|nr:hypothetical protein [Bacillus sp. M6-12]PLS17409.1 hypothetical protein CVD28_12710 [Bacillus sp. M6-12]